MINYMITQKQVMFYELNCIYRCGTTSGFSAMELGGGEVGEREKRGKQRKREREREYGRD